MEGFYFSRWVDVPGYGPVVLVEDDREVTTITYNREKDKTPKDRSLALLLSHLSGIQREQFSQAAPLVPSFSSGVLGGHFSTFERIPRISAETREYGRRYDLPMGRNQYVQAPRAFQAIGQISKRVHFIYVGTHANVLVFDESQPWYWCCSYLARGEPVYDLMLAQKLMIEGNEREFYKTVNIFGAL